MLRAERPRFGGDLEIRRSLPQSPREVLLAIAPPPKTQLLGGSGWPNWLIPTYRSGGHRPAIRLLEEER